MAPGYNSALLAELLDLDVEYRRRRGETPNADEYARRFPAFAPVVAEVFGRSAPDTLPEGGRGVAVPAVEPGTEPAGARRWFVNRAGLTMIGIGPGAFEYRAGTVSVVSRPYFLGAREVSVGEFQQFLADPDCPPDTKPTRPRAPGPDPAAPVNHVSQEEMLLFCNWLSRRDGRRPCYLWDEDRWADDPTADGYRLPTEAEWDLAQRAGSTTTFFFGDDARWLPAHAHVASGGLVAGGNRLPNRWGLFDVVGNVWEMCADRMGEELDRGGSPSSACGSTRPARRPARAGSGGAGRTTPAVTTATPGSGSAAAGRRGRSGSGSPARPRQIRL